MNENARLWVEALCSGKYKQTTKVLHNKDDDSYCCLGVACVIYQRMTGRDLPVFDGTWDDDESLPIEVQIWLGLRDESGMFEDSTLVNENDNGVRFAKIADIIESEPEGLFA